MDGLIPAAELRHGPAVASNGRASAPQVPPAPHGAVTSTAAASLQGDGWPEPDGIWGPPPAPPLPLDHFPKEIADVAADVAERQQAPTDFVAWALTVCAAGLIGRGAGVRPLAFDDWTERPCLWVNAIAPPSWMKTPALDAGMRPLRRQQERDHEAHTAALLAWRAECAALKAQNPKIQPSELPPEPVARRGLTSDSTTEKLAILLVPEVSRGLTLHRDELAGLINSLDKYTKGGDRQFYLQAYTGGAYTVDRVSRPSLFIPDLLLNVVGGIQPDVAREIFGTGPEDGLAARFLSVWPELSGEWQHVDRAPDARARAALDAVNDVLVAADWGATLRVDEFTAVPFCRPDAGGQESFAEWRTALMRDFRGGRYTGRHVARVGKYPGLAARLMLVFHLVEWAAGRAGDPRTIDAETAVKVLDLIDEYVLPMERRVYAQYAVPADAEGGRRIARWIEQARPERFTAREILRHDWSGLQTSAAVAAALDWLVTRRWLREAEREARPGRPPNAYLVNPRLRGHRG